MGLIIAAEMPRKKRIRSNFGERLVALRKVRGLTQTQLAEFLGTSQRAISYYENEGGYPPAPVVVELAKALGVTTDELLGAKPAEDAVPPAPETRRLWKQFQGLRALPERDQRAIIRLINSLGSSKDNGNEASEEDTTSGDQAFRVALR